MQGQSFFKQRGVLLAIPVVVLLLLVAVVAFLMSRPPSPSTTSGALPTPEASATRQPTSAAANQQETQPPGTEPSPPPSTPLSGASPAPDEQPSTGASGWGDTTIAPVLSISANGGGEVELFQGWPLLAHAEILHPAAFDASIPEAPLLVAAQQGPWSNALQIGALDDSGNVHTWPFHLAETPTSTLSLTVPEGAAVDWWISPEETTRLAAGSYQVIAYLDTRQVTNPGTWRGTVSSVPVAVRIAPEPASLSPEQLSLKYRLLAHYTLLRGDQAQALAHVETLLSRQPDDIAGLELKGDLLGVMGKVEEALQAYDQALRLYIQRYPDAHEPPHILLMKKRDILNMLLTEQP
jgi:hypothetical protein